MRIELKNRREAYEAVKPKRPNRKAMILEALTSGDPGGMTADEIGERLVKNGVIAKNDPNYVRPRLSEMKDDGIVEVVGRRLNLNGRSASVWKRVKNDRKAAKH